MIEKGKEFHKVMHDGRKDRRLSSEWHKSSSIVLLCKFGLLALTHKPELPVVEDPGS